MRILHILYSFGCGGAERFVADLANRQHAGGHEVMVCIIRPADIDSTFCIRFLDDGVAFESINISSGISLGKILSVKQFIDRVAPDIVHCHHNVMPYVCLAAMSIKAKFIHTIHSEGFRAAAGMADRIISKLLYRRFHVVPVAISENCADSFLQSFGIRPAVIINGRSMDTASDKLPEVRAFVDRVRSTSHTVAFIHVARYHKVKNQKALFDAFKILHGKGVDCSLTVLGDGFDASGLLENAAANIHYVGAVDNVSDYLFCCDAFCLSSFSEGLPISLLEALSFGLTPVCTAVGGIRDIIQDGVTGYLSTGVTAEEYAVALERCCAALIDRGFLKTYYMENFSIDTCFSRYMTVYEA